MTTHDKDKVLAAAIGCIEGPYDSSRAITLVGNEIECFYAIAFEDGRQAEREECAKVCESIDSLASSNPPMLCAKAIRARGDMK